MAEKAPRKRLRVEQGERGGWGRGLREQITVQITEELGDILRIMRANTGLTQGEILRRAAEGEGLASVDGYERARTEYDGGRRVSKPPASGGRRAGRGGADADGK